MTLLKGFAGTPGTRQRQPAQRTRDDNNIFGFVHCADEPLDVLRELAIMMPEPTLSEIHQRLAHAFDRDTEYDCRAEIEAVYAENPAHDIDSARALNRLLADLATAGTGVARALVAQLADCGSDQALDWLAFSTELRELGMDPLGWDPLIAASNLVPYYVPGRVKIIPSFTELQTVSLEDYSKRLMLAPRSISEYP